MNRILTLVNQISAFRTVCEYVEQTWHSEELQENVSLAKYIAIKCVQFSLLAGFLLVSASFVYALLYHFIIPSRLYEQPLYFNYHKHGITLPKASLDLLTSHTQWQASPRIDAGTIGKSVLLPGVSYDIFIQLDLPDSSVNTDIGMFMVSTTLQTNKSFLAESARPAIVQDAHWIIRTIRVLLFAYPLTFGLTKSSQSLSIQAFNGYMENNANPLTHVEVQLNHPRLQVYSGKLIVLAQLHGIRYLMYHWFFTSAILAIVNLAFLQGAGLVLLVLWHKLSIEELEEDEEEVEESRGDEVFEKDDQMDDPNDGEKDCTTTKTFAESNASSSLKQRATSSYTTIGAF